MFEQIIPAPPDPILGLNAAFRKDPRPGKTNLGVGVYKDEKGETAIFTSVKKAEERILSREKTKDYLAIEGAPDYASAVMELLFGTKHPLVEAGRALTAHTPGGTGALRVAADFIHRIKPESKIWMSDPTWANHGNIFAAAGLATATYPYYDAATKSLVFDRMIEGLRAIPEGDVVLLHGCCHNPTGLDPEPDQWRRIAKVLANRHVFPLVDFAYQGLADGIEADGLGMRIVIEACGEGFIASSYSKNFGLYNERTGALTLVASSGDAARGAFSHIQATIRANYSNPPSHGAQIVSTIINDPELKKEWENEVTAIRKRIREMRELFVQTLKEKGVSQDFSFIARQKGMFSFSGLGKEQVDRLREQYAIYAVGSGRINVAGMTRSNMDHVCGAIADVLKG